MGEPPPPPPPGRATNPQGEHALNEVVLAHNSIVLERGLEGYANPGGLGTGYLISPPSRPAGGALAHATTTVARVNIQTWSHPALWLFGGLVV